MNKKIDEEKVKEFIFTEIKKLKTYAITYQTFNKINFDEDIENINNTENTMVNNINQEHNYSKILFKL